MKKSSELAKRYAKALYSLASAADSVEQIFGELFEVKSVFITEPEIIQFVNSPLVGNDKKEAVINDGLNGNKLSPITKNFLKLLAKKDRFHILPEILDSYQEIIDEQTGVLRGLVSSTLELPREVRSEIETKISSATGKKVLLDYQVKQDLVGGLKAEVGTFTFDDSLVSHLDRLNEELNRRSL